MTKKGDKTKSSTEDGATGKDKKVHKKEATQIKALNEENEQLRDSLQRERADSENIRRRHQAQLQELKDYVAADTIRALLPVIDNVERALAHVPEELADHDYIKGVQGVAKQFNATLEKLGVTRIDTVGEVFDPGLHEAVSMDDSAGAGEEIISEELQSGYKMGDHIIRHAMVRVTLQPEKK